MLDLLLDLLQIGLLVAVGLEVRKLNKLTLKALLRLPSKAPIFTSPDISEVLCRHEGNWTHHSWVRKNSPAWKHAYDTSGMALREADKQLIEGVQ